MKRESRPASSSAEFLGRKTVSAALQPKGQRDPAIDIPLRKSRGHQEILVTPEIAQHWLTFNTANRVLTQANLEKMKAAMASDRWNDDGATIRFAYGKLLDGQHRLTAIVLTGKSLNMLVVFGLDADSQVTMDTGRPRTPRDILSIEGLDKWAASTMGSAIHQIIAFESGRAIYSPQKFENREVRDFYLENRSRLDLTIQACRNYPRRHPVLPLARVMTLHYFFAKRDAVLAGDFFDRLMSGVELARNSPIYHVRHLLDDDLKSQRNRSVFDQMFLVVRGWNVLRRGNALRSASGLYPRDGETFPEIM